MITSKLWIRALTETGEPIVTAAFRLQIYKETQNGYEPEHGNIVMFTHQGLGFYAAELEKSVFGTIQQEVTTGVWEDEAEAKNIVIPSVDLLKHIAGTGANHEIDEIINLEQTLITLENNLNNAIQSVDDELNILKNNLLFDLDTVKPTVSGNSPRGRDVVVSLELNEPAFGFWEIDYFYFNNEQGVARWDGANKIVSSQNKVVIPKPPEGSDLYQTGYSYLVFRAKFMSISGSESLYSNTTTVAVPPPDLTIEALVESIKTNPTMMSELADLLASKVVIETFHAQQSSV